MNSFSSSHDQQSTFTVLHFSMPIGLFAGAAGHAIRHSAHGVARGAVPGHKTRSSSHCENWSTCSTEMITCVSMN